MSENKIEFINVPILTNVKINKYNDIGVFREIKFENYALMHILCS